MKASRTTKLKAGATKEKVTAGSRAKAKAGAEPKLNAFDEVYKVVRRIPRGRVATYGQVAKLLPKRWSPALVGWALHALPTGSDVPWFRVVDGKGQLGTRKLPGESVHVQKDLLEEEGIELDGDGRCDLARHQWKPREKGC